MVPLTTTYRYLNHCFGGLNRRRNVAHRLQLSTSPKAKTVDTIAGDIEERITSKLKKGEASLS